MSVALFTCSSLACVKQHPLQQPLQQPQQPHQQQPLVPPSAPSLLQHWEEEASAFVKTQNALFWQHWTLGKPLDLENSYAPFEKFFSEKTWEQMHNVPKPDSAMQACTLKNLKALVLGELLARKLREQNRVVALLENTLTVMHQAKDFPWHELGRLLAHEKDAAHRRNLWLDSLKTAERLDVAIQTRQQRIAEVLKHWGVDEAYAIQLFRDVDLKKLASQVQARLHKTQAQWCAQVEALTSQQPGMDKATRADLPFFFKTKLVNANRYFSAEQQAAVAEAVFERLRLWPASRLVRHLGEARAYPALPLALNGGFEASQLSFTPVQGPNSLKQLLGEMGRALSWTHVAQNQWACRHLGPSVLSEASALLFSQLAQDKTWLAEQTVPMPIAEAWEKAFYMQTEFEFRKTAAHFLSQMASSTLKDEEASQAYLATQSEVLCTKSLKDEAVRKRIDSEEFFAMADTLRAGLLAEQMWEYLLKRFGKTWWNKPEAGAWLKALWQEGNAVPAELSFEGLVRPVSL